MNPATKRTEETSLITISVSYKTTALILQNTVGTFIHQDTINSTKKAGDDAHFLQYKDPMLLLF